MCVPRIFISGPNPCFLRQIPVIVCQHFQSPLQMAWFYAKLTVWVCTRERRPILPLLGVGGCCAQETSCKKLVVGVDYNG